MVLPLDSVLLHMAKKLHSVVLMLVLLLVEVSVVHPHMNHQAIHQVASVVMLVLVLLLVEVQVSVVHPHLNHQAIHQVVSVDSKEV